VTAVLAAAFLTVLTLLTPPSLHAQAEPWVHVREIGPGRAGRLVRAALAGPHATIVADSGVVALRRDTAYATTVVVIAPRATIASRVHGDVIVVGGDLFLHPGAVIDGRAVAIGGGVYNSTLAVVRGGLRSYRDATFDIARAGDTLLLDYRALGSQREEIVYLPAVVGFNLPSYDRVNGLSLPWGPAVAIDSGRIIVEPSVTYRSHLGAFDPAVAVAGTVGRQLTATLYAGRGTVTNDAWIRPDWLNSVGVAIAGVDTRNYYRADRAELRIGRRWASDGVEIEPFAGALTELARSVGPRTLDASAPYSFTGRRDSLGMLRPNPAIRRGRISSALAGVRGRWEEGAGGGVAGSLLVATEAPFDTPGGERFVQTTIDGDVAFPAFLNHRFELFAHVVLTAGDTAPPQRFAYLGGNATLLTRDLLSLGGDQLFFTDARYAVPLDRLLVPYLGAPTVTLRHLAGSAGPARLPAFVQNVGLRFEISVLRLDYLIDPSTRESNVNVSLAFFR